MADDPFSLVYETLWSEVENSAALTESIRKGNRIKLVKTLPVADHEPRLPVITPGSSPQLILLPDFFESNLSASNNAAEIKRIYNWIVRTSDRILNLNLFPIEWALYKAMYQCRKTLYRLQFEDKTFITNVRILQGSDKIPEVEQAMKNPQVTGWKSIWYVEVTMQFDLRS